MSEPEVIWYFDVISPFAYLQSTRIGSLPDDVTLACKPVVFAGLLDHWGQLGPAEIVPKKAFIFRQSIWRAKRRGIAYRSPPKHPFNPLRALRLCISLQSRLDVIQKIFRSIWVDGHLPDDEAGWAAIQQAVGISDGDERVADPAVKAALHSNGEAAIAAGVFGVPTMVINGEVFWGDDAFEMAHDYLADPEMFKSNEMLEINKLQSSAERRR